jgi:hypothetical protein
MALIGHWPLDDGPYTYVTTAVDLSGGSHDGTYHHSSGRGVRAGGPTAKRRSFAAGNCYTWGNGSYVYPVANDAVFALTGEMACAAWVSRSGIAVGDYGVVAFFGSTGEDQPNNDLFGFYCQHQDLHVWWEHTAGVDVVVDTTADRAAGTKQGFQHVAFIRRLFGGGPNLEVEFFVDGASAQLLDNGAAGYTPPDGGGNGFLCLGNARGGYSKLSRLADVRIWDSDPGAAAILAAYNAGAPYLESTPVVEFPLSDDTFAGPNTGALRDKVFGGSEGGRPLQGYTGEKGWSE